MKNEIEIQLLEDLQPIFKKYELEVSVSHGDTTLYFTNPITKNRESIDMFEYFCNSGIARKIEKLKDS